MEKKKKLAKESLESKKTAENAEKSIKGKNSSEKAEKSRNSQNIPTNIFNHHSIWIGNILDNFDRTKFRNIFEEFGKVIEVFHLPNTTYAFVEYDNQKSPITAIANYKNRELDGISNGKLSISFTPSKKHSQRQSYDRMSFEMYSTIVNKAGECQYWRTGSKCPKGSDCEFMHISINRRIDPLPKSCQRK